MDEDYPEDYRLPGFLAFRPDLPTIPYRDSEESEE